MPADEIRPASACATPDEDPGRQVIARAAAILRTLEGAPAGLTIAEITRASGLPRTTVTRLVGALHAERMVAGSGRIRLGPALARLAAAAHLDATSRVRPHIEALARTVRETVDLWIERDTAVELVDTVTSDQEVRIVVTPGSRLSLPCTAPGKVFLATLDPDMRDQRIDASEGRPLAPQARARLLADLEETYRTGLGLDLEEHSADVCAVAMAVDLGLMERYAIAIPAPARRFHARRDDFVTALRACVAAIEAGD